VCALLTDDTYRVYPMDDTCRDVQDLSRLPTEPHTCCRMLQGLDYVKLRDVIQWVLKQVFEVLCVKLLQ